MGVWINQGLVEVACSCRSAPPSCVHDSTADVRRMSGARDPTPLLGNIGSERSCLGGPAQSDREVWSATAGVRFHRLLHVLTPWEVLLVGMGTVRSQQPPNGRLESAIHASCPSSKEADGWISDAGPGCGQRAQECFQSTIS